MTAPISIVVPGEPVAKGRPRLAVLGGHARAFTPAKTRSYEAEIRQYAADAMGERPPMSCAVTVTVRAYMAIPKSMAKKHRPAALAGDLRPTKRPDGDNFLKALCDACNGVVFTDDALAVTMTVEKLFSDRPRLEAEIAPHRLPIEAAA